MCCEGTEGGLKLPADGVNTKTRREQELICERINTVSCTEVGK